jgi:hypothetical protein
VILKSLLLGSFCDIEVAFTSVSKESMAGRWALGQGMASENAMWPVLHRVGPFRSSVAETLKAFQLVFTAHLGTNCSDL